MRVTHINDIRTTTDLQFLNNLIMDNNFGSNQMLMVECFNRAIDLGYKGKFPIPDTKKFIVVDTWNGEGYSDLNGSEIKMFDDQVNAERYAQTKALNELPLPSDSRYEGERLDILRKEDQVDDEEFLVAFQYEIDDDHGSYQVHELKKNAYAVMVRCNINDVVVLTELEFKQEIKQLKEEFLEVQKRTGEDEEDYFDYQPGGDIFISAWDDYDFQFRLLKNVESPGIECHKCGTNNTHDTDEFGFCKECLTQL